MVGRCQGSRQSTKQRRLVHVSASAGMVRGKVLTEGRDFLSHPIHPFMRGIIGFWVIASIECNLDKEGSELWLIQKLRGKIRCESDLQP